MAIPYFDSLDLNGNRARDAADAVLPQDYVTLAQLTASNTIGFAATIGNGVSVLFNVVHGLNSTDVLVQVQEVVSGDVVGVGVSTNGVNSVDVTFAVAPASNSFRVIVIKAA